VGVAGCAATAPSAARTGAGSMDTASAATRQRNRATRRIELPANFPISEMTGAGQRMRENLTPHSVAVILAVPRNRRKPFTGKDFRRSEPGSKSTPRCQVRVSTWRGSKGAAECVRSMSAVAMFNNRSGHKVTWTLTESTRSMVKWVGISPTLYREHVSGPPSRN
jgi:hypothetical protein